MHGYLVSLLYSMSDSFTVTVNSIRIKNGGGGRAFLINDPIVSGLLYNILQILQPAWLVKPA